MIDYVEKYYDKEDYYVYMPIVQFTNNQSQKIQSILNIELDDQEYPFGKEIAIKYNDKNLEYVLKDMKIKKFVYKNSLAIGMILMIISILYLHLNK